ncbi:hypothetical protein BDA99DRAFT_513887 [Phascolomyces articulosus]|uniref:RING-type domain-containing protein n=1 Tax=Phascolomyces articulosus TaxID=60185 RepID=A0AAD5PD89_9FUNG|nr:hypothetical protein BDA99DRAFT_513887 [Phascolomyces articulosus]
MSTSRSHSSPASSDDHSLRRPQRKKRQASLNHLINFSFPDRPDNIDSHGSIIHHDDDPFSSSLTTYKPYRKEHYVNANFRFLLDPSGDYSRHLDDPDACFDWDLIEQVLVYSTQVPSCPICLDTPTAARIAECGHIYCLSCILHSFHESGRICPICLDPTTVRELRPIMTLPCSKYKVGDGIDLCLMRRKPSSMHPMPVNNDDHGTKSTTTIMTTDGIEGIPHDNAELLPYARFMLASHDTLETTRERDTAAVMASIEACQHEDHNDGELAALLTSLDLISNNNSKNKNNHKQKQQQQQQRHTNRNHNHNHHQGDEQLKCYYFYQANDGQWVFPGSHTIRTLLQAFGDYPNFPPKITSAPVTHVEEQLLTEEGRKRYKFLGHVPLGCNITWIEVDLKGVVPEELLVVTSSSSSIQSPRQPEEEDEEKNNGDQVYQDEEEEESALDSTTLPIKEEWSDEEEMLEYVLKLSTVQQ